MLNYSILRRKAKILLGSDYENTTTVKCIDLLSNTFKNINVALYPIVVNKYYTARPDLVSFALYQTPNYADIICKVNGISNPFEINEGDILLVPYIDDIKYFLKNGEPSELAPDTDSLVSVDKPLQKRLDEKRSANEQVIGDANFIIDKSTNLIFY